jgi:hypothetical protein
MTTGVLVQENGFWTDPSGLILQWGRATLFGGGGSTAVRFPIAFPTECLNVMATPIASPNTGLAYTVQVEAVANDKALVNGNRDDGGGIVSAPQMDVFWRAIGH